MQPRTLLRAWKTGGFIRRLSGLTLEPSTLSHGVESWIASLRATRASPTPSPVSSSDLMTNDGWPTTLSASSSAAGLTVSSVRTSRGTPMASWPGSSPHWKEWVVALRLEYSARLKLAEATRENASSSWPTAKVQTGDYSYSQGDHTKPILNLEGRAKRWPTITVGDSESGQAKHSHNAQRGGGDSRLRVTAAQWPKVRACSGERSSGANRTELVNCWATPRSSDGEKGGPSSRDGSGSLHLTSQAVQASARPTPAARDWRDDGSAPSAHERNSPCLPATASRFSPPAPATHDGPPSSPERRTLNPLFVEWLMGWPIGWTACEPVETECSQWLRQMRGHLSTLLSGRADRSQERLFA